MKGSSWFPLLLITLLLFPAAIRCRHISQQAPRHGGQNHHHHRSQQRKGDKQNSLHWERKTAVSSSSVRRSSGDTVEVAGSRLPDCSHACGSCSPCRLVMISFVCASLQEAETCPMAYRCMCNNKSYPVP